MMVYPRNVPDAKTIVYGSVSLSVLKCSTKQTTIMIYTKNTENINRNRGMYMLGSISYMCSLFYQNENQLYLLLTNSNSLNIGLASAFIFFISIYP